MLGEVKVWNMKERERGQRERERERERSLGLVYFRALNAASGKIQRVAS